ncbi:hypothetical protein K438DRAFT_1617536 [Mycena galopus ATCC 62051]|nr:hypothetical protein K438DRAFT_1617536 [Mycena galopus ATCC 62051]
MLIDISLSLSFFVVASAVQASGNTTKCKCTVNDSCWPTAREWAALSATLSHPVFDIMPAGYYCHDPNYNAALCAVAQAHTANPIWRADQPGAEQSDIWEYTGSQQCDILGNRTTPCGQGRVPAVGVNATTVSDIKNALSFAFQRNLKVHIKNTGHDFLGRGLGPGSLMIWTHYFVSFDFVANFTYATGQSAGAPAVAVTSGTQWADTYAFAAENNVELAGGIGPLGSVGSGGGWPLGGGHNIISPHLGLGADNVLEVDLVLPNGTLVTTNQYENADLFWAVRGGGGPSFGVATRLVYRAHPPTPLYALFFTAVTATPAAFLSLLTLFHTSLPALADAGWSGYYPFTPPTAFALMYLQPNGNTTSGNATFNAFLEAAAAVPGVNVTTSASASYSGFQSWFVANILDPVDVVGYNYTANTITGSGVAVGSWLLPRALFEKASSVQVMSEAMAAFPAAIGQHVAGGVVSALSPDFNALHPAWRTALVDVVTPGVWPDGASAATIAAVRQSVSSSLAPLRALTPGGAQYLNEPDQLVPQSALANWGSHYPRLLDVKRAVDPTNQLLVLQGVGSGGWDSEQICLTS